MLHWRRPGAAKLQAQLPLGDEPAGDDIKRPQEILGGLWNEVASLDTSVTTALFDISLHHIPHHQPTRECTHHMHTDITIAIKCFPFSVVPCPHSTPMLSLYQIVG